MISGIVLAAGTSSRFGETKQLVELDGKPIVQHAVDAASAAGLDEIIVVLGHDADLVEKALRLPKGGRTVTNLEYEEGQSSSLAAGLAAADPSSEAAIVLLADQPGMREEVMRRLAGAYRERRARIVRARFRNAPGPALLSREIWPEIAAVTGDTGARELIATHPEWVEELDIEADAPPDIDTWTDYEAAHHHPEPFY